MLRTYRWGVHASKHSPILAGLRCNMANSILSLRAKISLAQISWSINPHSLSRDTSDLSSTNTEFRGKLVHSEPRSPFPLLDHISVFDFYYTSCKLEPICDKRLKGAFNTNRLTMTKHCTKDRAERKSEIAFDPPLRAPARAGQP